MPRNTQMSAQERVDAFWAKVIKTETCWLWTGGVSKKGYGHAYMGPLRQSPRRRAHKVAWELLVGPVPEGLTLDHVAERCSSKLCVNPKHLEVVTAEENTRRANALRILPDTCPKGHEFTEENTERPVRKNKDGTEYRTRVCIECRRAGNRAAYAKKKAAADARL